MARERSKEFLDAVGAHVARRAEAWGAHQNGYFDVAREAVEKGEYPPGRWLSDLARLSLECFGLTLECVLSGGGDTPRSRSRSAPGAIALDQQSQMGGPVPFPALDDTGKVPRRVQASSSSGGVPPDKIYARVLPDGRAWACLVDLFDVDAKPGSYSVTIEGATLTFTVGTAEEGKVLFGLGTVPEELANDPSLDLRDLLGTPENSW